MSYRSNIKHTLEGESKWSFADVQAFPPRIRRWQVDPRSPSSRSMSLRPTPCRNCSIKVTGSIRAISLPHLHPNSKAKTAIDTPEMLSFNAFHQLNDKVALMADLTFTRHSRLDEVRIGIDQVAGYPYFNGVTEGDLSVKQDWKDTYKISLGMNYQYSDDLLLRTGVAYDKSPVNSTQLRHPAFPDADRYWAVLRCQLQGDP